MTLKIKIYLNKKNKDQICRKILRSLPQWFGIEKAIQKYTEMAKHLPMFVAEINKETIGFLSLDLHNRWTAEIHVMGLLEEYHRQGVGKALIKHAENYAKKKGCKYLEVKTLGPSRENREYKQTRKFYLSLGFVPIEEIKNFWGKNPCLIMIKNLFL